MKFEYDEEEEYASYKTDFLDDNDYALIRYMRNLTGALPVRMGDDPVYLCSSPFLLKDTHSIFVSDYK